MTIFQEINFAREQFPAAWEEILDKHFDRFCRGELSAWEQRRARSREVFDLPELTDADCDERHRLFLSFYEPGTRAYSDALSCLESLAGESLGIISNGIREQQLGKLERAGLLRYFSVFVFFEDSGRGKPAPEIFLEACRQAGETPELCIDIGDRLEADVIPSRALGMQGIWLNRESVLNNSHDSGISTLTRSRWRSESGARKESSAYLVKGFTRWPARN